MWERWDGTLWNCQDRYLQVCALNLNEPSLEPVQVRDPELHSIFRFFVGVLLIYFLPFPLQPSIHWQDI